MLRSLSPLRVAAEAAALSATGDTCTTTSTAPGGEPCTVIGGSLTITANFGSDGATLGDFGTLTAVCGALRVANASQPLQAAVWVQSRRRCRV